MDEPLPYTILDNFGRPAPSPDPDLSAYCERKGYKAVIVLGVLPFTDDSVLLDHTAMMREPRPMPKALALEMLRYALAAVEAEQ